MINCFRSQYFGFFMVYSNLYAKFYSTAERASGAVVAVWRWRPGRWYFLAFLVVQSLAWWQAEFIYRQLAGSVLVLHYNVDFGIDLVGDPAQVFGYPLYGLGIFIVNYLIAAAGSGRRDKNVYNHLLLAGAVIFGLALNLALMFIYLINFK